jgi:hypothetical protein
MTILAFSSSRRQRDAHAAPPATPPITTILFPFMIFFSGSGFCIYT